MSMKELCKAKVLKNVSVGSKDMLIKDEEYYISDINDYDSFQVHKDHEDYFLLGKEYYPVFKKLDKNNIDLEDIYDLGFNLAEYILPRLKNFRENVYGYPCSLTFNEWENIIDKMIKAFEIYLEDEIKNSNEQEKEDKLMTEGFKLFGEWFTNLWL